MQQLREQSEITIKIKLIALKYNDYNIIMYIILSLLENIVSNDLTIDNKDIKDFIDSLNSGDLVEIYTDGSCMGNPGPGGWGAVFLYHNIRSIMSGYEEKTTNNRMELIAAIESISIIPNSVNIDIYTDSEYVKNGITIWVHSWVKNNWKTANNKKVRNQDLWQQLYYLNQNKNITWHWVKGHSNCINNENADFVARSAILNNNQ